MDQELAVGTIVRTADGRRARVTGYDEQERLMVEYLDTAPAVDESASLPPVSLGAVSEGGVKDFGRTALQGLSFGFSDEARGLGSGLASLARGGTFGEGYSEGVEAERAALQAYRERNPLAALAAEGLGGVATGFGVAGGLRALPGLARLARGGSATGKLGRAQGVRAAQVGQTGGGTAGRALGSLDPRTSAVALGATEGGIYGFGAGEDSLKQRLTGAAIGGAAGGIAAPVMTGAMALAGKGKGFLSDVVAGQRGVKGAASRQAKTDEMMAESLMREAPTEFTQKGQQWLQTARRVVDDVNAGRTPVKAGTGRRYTADEIDAFKKGLRDYQESGQSVIVAGLLGKASDAIERDLTPNLNTPRLLADVTEDFSATAAQVTGQGGDEVQKLRTKLNSGPRGNQTQSSLNDLNEAAQLDRNIGGVRARRQAIETEKKNIAKKDYDAFYEARNDWDTIIASAGSAERPGVVAIMSRLRDATKQSPELRQRLVNAFAGVGEAKAASSVAREGVETTGPLTLRELSSQYDAERLASGRALGFNEILDDVSRANPSDFDQFRRAIKQAKDEAHLEGNYDLRDSLNQIVVAIDDAIADTSTAFADARRGYQANMRRLEAYEDGANLKDVTTEDLRFLHDNPWTLRKHSSIEGLSGDEVADIRKAFREGHLNSIADVAEKLAEESDARGADFVRQQYKRLFDGPEAPFARHVDAINPVALNRVGQNLDSRSLLARTNKRASDVAERGGSIIKDVTAVEGAVPATAALYGLAGQFGAMGRTGVASLIYGTNAQEKFAQHLAKRLGQKESRGLLDMVETLKRTERNRVGGLLRERGASAGAAALTQPMSADFSATLQNERRYR